MGFRSEVREKLRNLGEDINILFDRVNVALAGIGELDADRRRLSEDTATAFAGGQTATLRLADSVVLLADQLGLEFFKAADTGNLLVGPKTKPKATRRKPTAKRKKPSRGVSNTRKGKN